MAKLRENYEAMVVFSLKAEEDAIKALVEKFKNLIEKNGTLTAEVDEWGKRRLAYPINYENEGYYVLIYFRSAPDFVAELNRVLGITEDALRYIVLSVDEKKQTINVRHGAPEVVESVDTEDVTETVEEAPAAETEAEEEAPAAEEAPAEAAEETETAAE